MKPYKCEFWKSAKNGQWYWHGQARNGKTTCFIGEGVKRKHYVKQSARDNCAGVANGCVPLVEIKDPNAKAKKA